MSFLCNIHSWARWVFYFSCSFSAANFLMQSLLQWHLRFQVCALLNFHSLPANV